MYEGIFIHKNIQLWPTVFFFFYEHADMLFFYSYEAAFTSVNFQFIFNIIPDISALKMCRGALLQLAAPIRTPEMLHCAETFMFPGVIIPF